jgi:uncharacterized protein YggL (DUF469 family)
VAAATQRRSNDHGTVSAPCPAFGFVVELEPAAGLAAERLATLRVEWAAFLDERGLRGREQRVGTQLRFEVQSEASQATQNDRAAVERWLSTRTEVARCRVGDIHDLPPDP